MPEAITIRIDRKTKSRLGKLPKTLRSSKSHMAAEAIRAFVDLNEWQIAEIREAAIHASS